LVLQGLLDSLVGLAIELYKSLNGEEVDFTHYKFGLVEQYKNFRQNQFCQWMVYGVDESGSMFHAELIACARRALNFSDNTILSTVGLNQEMSEQGLLERSWMTG